jgi:hypothetical protein
MGKSVEEHPVTGETVFSDDLYPHRDDAGKVVLPPFQPTAFNFSISGMEQSYKRIYADDLAVMLDFEWDYEEAEDDDLYEALESMGYRWDGKGWQLI